MLALLQQLERDATLFQGNRFADRVDAIDQIDGFLMPATPDTAGNFDHLQARARAMLDALESANARVCTGIRDAVVRGEGGRRLRAWLDLLGAQHTQRHGYDHADALVAGMFDFANVEDTGAAPGADMVFYQPTPVRHVVSMINALSLQAGDTLVDLGSGLGHVPMLANILTGASAIGIELQAPLAARARDIAKSLRLDGVSFQQGDARKADFSAGNVFYLYTPFKGVILDEVLTRLADAATRRPLRIATFGPCTLRVGQEPWLACTGMPGESAVCVFRSR